MNHPQSRQGNMQEVVNAVHQNGYHSRGISGPQGSGIFHVLSRCHYKVILDLFQDLPRTWLHRYKGNDMRRRCQIKFGMTPLYDNNLTARGFTLIELLVVVLIIGILAAVAVPQYQKAVAKSRFAALKPLAKAVKDAQEVYYHEHGVYGNWDDLDIDIPAEADLELSNINGHEYVRATSDKLDNNYTLYFDHSANFAGNAYCEALTDDDPLCIAEGGHTDGQKNGNYILYLISGNSTGNFGPVITTTSCGTNCTRYAVGDKNVDVEYVPTSYSGPMITVDSTDGYEQYWWKEGNYGGSQYGGPSLCEKYPFVEQCKSLSN